MDEPRSNFIRNLIDDDLKTEKYSGRVVTRFPPEPNGYLHIGHAKAVCLNFGLARDYVGGVAHLRFDDTNPTTEDIEFVEAIQADIRWLGFEWGENLFFTSDYFQQLHDFAVQLIQKGKAYVCDLSEEDTREYRGTVQTPGSPSPGRNRSIEENLTLFAKMRAGDFEEGSMVLRAAIDMSHPNMKMRDPLLYRIRKAHHYRTGNDWPIYPMYDFAHCLSDALEKITHSICTLEFENNRDVYDWLVAEIGFPEPPEQTEMARLNLGYTVTSKRKLLELVQEGHVKGWDDPRMTTIAGMRRRGYPPMAIRNFCDMIGVAKAHSLVDMGKLEFCVRDTLNFESPRVMAVLDPLKVVLTNYPEGQVDEVEASFYPHDVPKEGTRKVPFTKELYIERTDFLMDPPPKFFRLSPGNKVRLRYGYIIQCDEVIHDAAGEVQELRCSYIPESKSGSDTSGLKVKGTIHWVSASHGVQAEVRLYDRLFSVAVPGAERDSFLDDLNPTSQRICEGAWIEPSVRDISKDTRFQFTRTGYFWQDPEESQPEHLIFNQIVGLRNSWEKEKPANNEAKKEASKSVKSSSNTLQGSTDSQKKSPAQKVRELSSKEAKAASKYTALGVSKDDAETLATVAAIAPFFEEAMAVRPSAQPVANWVCNELLRVAKERPIESLPFSGDAIGHLVALIEEDVISSKIGKEVFEELLANGGDPRVIVKEKGLLQITDPEAIRTIIRSVLTDNPGEVDAYRGGKTKLFGFFIGKVMKASGGKANPTLTRSLVEEMLQSKE